MIVVLGLGRETRQLLDVLARQQPGAEVLVLDEGVTNPPGAPQDLDLQLTVRGGVDFEQSATIPPAALAVYRSPGVSPYRPALLAARRRGVPVTTPTGWWAARRDGRDTIAITGTKGKSTTAALTAHLLRAHGRAVALVGNIGRGALDVDTDPVDDVVLELSSYQLVDFDAPVALGGITTLLRDHVPWHGTVARYHGDKLRLLDLAQRTIVTPRVADHRALTGVLPPASVTASALRDHIRAALAVAGLVGDHLVEDAELALALVDARLALPGGVMGLIGALSNFRSLPHRLTAVAEHGGVRFVDDSISTVPESAVAAVRAYRGRGPVTVLLGGDDRGQDLDPLVALLADKHVRAVVMPPLGRRLLDAFAPVAPGRVHEAADLAAAVEIAIAITPPGASIILSPAAPSFTSYRDFIARGEHFVSLVTALVASR